MNEKFKNFEDIQKKRFKQPQKRIINLKNFRIKYF